MTIELFRNNSYLKEHTSKVVNILPEGLVFDETIFYPEGGGQVGDKGYLEAPNGDVIYILNTKKENNVIIHFAKNLPNLI